MRRLMMVLVVAAGVALVPAGPARAVSGLVKVAETAGPDSTSPKTVSAWCPAGTRIIGGGGWAFATQPADETKVLLTRLRPASEAVGDRYIVSATEVAGGITGDWWVDAYAICAQQPVGYEITSATTLSASSTVQRVQAKCPTGKKVVGTGAQITGSAGQVSIATMRTYDLAEAEAVAVEDANGFANMWSVAAYAVCVNPLVGLSLEFGPASALNSQDSKSASVTCPPTTKVHSAAVEIIGIQGIAGVPAGVAVQKAFPNSTLNRVDVSAVEPTPIAASWRLRAQALCAP